LRTEIVPELVTLTVAVEKSVVRCGGSRDSTLSSTRVAPARVLARDELLQKGLVGGKVGEIARATQLECFPQANLQMAVRSLHRTVLVTDAGIVTARLHVIMAAKLSIARRLVVLGR
jgi:hypothetical protein